MTKAESKPGGAEEKEQVKPIINVSSDSDAIKSGRYYVEKKGERVVAEVGTIRITAYDYTLTPVESEEGEPSEPSSSK